MIPEWFKIRKYPHIGEQIKINDIYWLENYVTDPVKIRKHSFLPFIHRKVTSRKFRKCYSFDTDSIKNSGLRNKDTKTRDIYYAAHLDANIYSYYAYILGKYYTEALKIRGLNDVSIAYRRILIKKNNKTRGMNNVDFAEEVFSFIRNNKDSELVAMTFDIKSFFDNLDHRIIKEVWKNILKTEHLPDDHYNVYRNITKFSYVDEKDIFNIFKDRLISQNEQRMKVDKIKYLRNKGIVSFCNINDFRNEVRNCKFVKSNKYVFDEQENKYTIRNKGIPQGSPISAILANVYLLEFDTLINAEVNDVKGLYRRYSDDIVLVCHRKYQSYFEELIKNRIENYKVELQGKKTNRYLFVRNNNRYKCLKILRNNDLTEKRKFEYLGFEFDGHYSSIKSSSMSKYYRKMKKAVRKGSFYAKYTKYKKDKGKIFRRRIYKRYTYLGSNRKLSHDQKNGSIQKKHNWGNFITYAKMAYYNMEHSKAKKQIRNHWDKLNRMIRDEEDKISRN